MSTNTIYIVVAISLLHFVAGIVFLVRKLSGPVKEDMQKDDTISKGT
ncbi:MAG: hypothetical protein IT258_13310 [Saprospiraceae bacterium]|nr:hypothetical protein [Saprospiraceae bacterium]